jgi:hypothetical protein
MGYMEDNQVGNIVPVTNPDESMPFSGGGKITVLE